MDTSNFKRLSPLTEVYALENDKVYLVLCDAKHFSLPHAHSLLKDLRQMHPEVNVSIVVTTKPKSIKIMEQKSSDHVSDNDT